jgi:hypothetical protein
VERSIVTSLSVEVRPGVFETLICFTLLILAFENLRGIFEIVQSQFCTLSLNQQGGIVLSELPG